MVAVLRCPDPDVCLRVDAVETVVGTRRPDRRTPQVFRLRRRSWNPYSHHPDVPLPLPTKGPLSQGCPAPRDACQGPTGSTPASASTTPRHREGLSGGRPPGRRTPCNVVARSILRRDSRRALSLVTLQKINGFSWSFPGRVCGDPDYAGREASSSPWEGTNIRVLPRRVRRRPGGLTGRGRAGRVHDVLSLLRPGLQLHARGAGRPPRQRAGSGLSDPTSPPAVSTPVSRHPWSVPGFRLGVGQSPRVYPLEFDSFVLSDPFLSPGPVDRRGLGAAPAPAPDRLRKGPVAREGRTSRCSTLIRIDDLLSAGPGGVQEVPLRLCETRPPWKSS